MYASGIRGVQTSHDAVAHLGAGRYMAGHRLSVVNYRTAWLGKGGQFPVVCRGWTVWRCVGWIHHRPHNSAILPLFQKKLPLVGVAGGIKGMFSNMGEQVVRGIAPFLGGMGAALLLYSFMNISHVQINAFVGVAAVVLLLQNIGNQGGFLFGLLFSFANSITKGRVPRFITITRMLTGMTVGFTVAVGLSMAGVKWSILLGLPILLLAILLALVLNRKKAA